MAGRQTRLDFRGFIPSSPVKGNEEEPQLDEPVAGAGECVDSRSALYGTLASSPCHTRGQRLSSVSSSPAQPGTAAPPSPPPLSCDGTDDEGLMDLVRELHPSPVAAEEEEPMMEEEAPPGVDGDGHAAEGPPHDLDAEGDSDHEHEGQ